MPPVAPPPARLSVTVRDRRIDLAVPTDVPLIALLPAVLRHAGADAADAGAGRGGWVACRADGAALSGAKTLADQGVRDGAALCLRPADEWWAEPEYDDVVDAVAAVPRFGRPWNPTAGRTTAAILGGGLILAALAALIDADSPTAGALAGGLALILLGAGIVAARGYGDDASGVLCAGLAIPAAVVAGAIAGPSVLVGVAIATTVATAGGWIGLGRAAWPSVAGAVVGAVALAGAVLDGVLPSGAAAGVFPSGAAAGAVLPGGAVAGVVLAALALSAALVPAVAARSGGLIRLAGADLDRVAEAVARTDEITFGLLVGVAVTASAAATIATRGGAWAVALVAVSAGVLGLRSRAYPSIGHRWLALAGGVAVALPIAVAFARRGPVDAAGAIAVAGVVTVLWGASTRRAPYLARAADLVEAAGGVAVIPLACGAAGLYTRLRGLA